jgi:hypothetical protein
MSRETAPTTNWLVFGVAASVGVVIGSLGTWATVTGGVSANGMDAGDGVLTLILALVALVGLWAYWKEPRRWAAVGVLVLGILIFGIGIYDLLDIEDVVDADTSEIVSSEWGLHLVLIESVLLVLSSLALIRRSVC